jgi:hypothetical protein
MKAPFSARRRAVRLDVGAVDRRQPVDRALSGQRLEYRKPDALPVPAIEPVLDRRVWPIGCRAIPPARPGPHDPADYPTVVHLTSPATAPTEKRLDPSPLRIAQPIDSLLPNLPVTEALNHRQQALLSTNPKPLLLRVR